MNISIYILCISHFSLKRKLLFYHYQSNDDTIYNIFGDELNAVTDFNQLIPDVGTYDGRNFGGNYCPGILLDNFTLTL